MGKIWLIRHGLTMYNEAQNAYKEAGNDMKLAPFRWDLDFCDAWLSQDGVRQAEAARDSAHSLDVQKVFVSPLRRALQTCKILFEGHPNSPQIVVQPVLHEVIHNSHDVSMYEGSPFAEFSMFDWSLVPTDGIHLARHILNNQYTALIEGLQYREASLKLLGIMREIAPEYVEDENTEALARAQRTKEIWKSQVEAQGIALVAHSNYFAKLRSFTDEHGALVEPEYIRQCEILEYELTN